MISPEPASKKMNHNQPTKNNQNEGSADKNWEYENGASILHLTNNFFLGVVWHLQHFSWPIPIKPTVLAHTHQPMMFPHEKSPSSHFLSLIGTEVFTRVGRKSRVGAAQHVKWKRKSWFLRNNIVMRQEFCSAKPILGVPPEPLRRHCPFLRNGCL
jgi:hypothetical protein